MIGHGNSNCLFAICLAHGSLVICHVATTDQEWLSTPFPSSWHKTKADRKKQSTAETDRLRPNALELQQLTMAFKTNLFTK
jgi:hypothetical protein